LCPVRNFNQVNGEFVQIFHTGNAHWVCVALVGCQDGTVNLYNSLYHTIILNEVQEQVLNIVGRKILLQFKLFLNNNNNNNKNNNNNCGVFAAAFATCLAYGIHPQTVQVDILKMRTHLYHSLKTGVLQMSPTF